MSLKSCCVKFFGRNISTMVDIIGRTMSTMDESKEELRDSASQQSNANVVPSEPPVPTEPPDVLVCSTQKSLFFSKRVSVDFVFYLVRKETKLGVKKLISS